ncbi:unnamed protein product [Prorocentrum cordatum]|uniref:Uncharacterized protein n=1 Tax=Prorocentrum cordatum TaxID=2364126 RepID=A0ABN9TL01_9DINO|nr:unnamed protein product [Polarella glacialis]
MASLPVQLSSGLTPEDPREISRSIRACRRRGPPVLLRRQTLTSPENWPHPGKLASAALAAAQRLDRAHDAPGAAASSAASTTASASSGSTSEDASSSQSPEAEVGPQPGTLAAAAEGAGEGAGAGASSAPCGDGARDAPEHQAPSTAAPTGTKKRQTTLEGCWRRAAAAAGPSEEEPPRQRRRLMRRKTPPDAAAEPAERAPAEPAPAAAQPSRGAT